MKEEKLPHTKEALHWWKWGVGCGEALEPWSECSHRGAEGKAERFPRRGSVPTSTHQPERLLCSPTDRWGLGAEALASEVRSQGEDRCWLCEHSLNGTSAPQLTGRNPGKSLELPKSQETAVSGCTRRGDSFSVCTQKSEHCLNKLQRWA